ncbi:ATP-dependent DNA helicase [Thermus composti]|uniref:DNA 3'-5' helicase n=1 Tax=Thermus composti TaxID=532059 RepID=A0ABV6PZ06_9DEIN|nr:ATP-dependent DNA helicase [Thermus composti]GGM97050.1 ATP-dependent DNA helicase [Thermus composti]
MRLYVASAGTGKTTALVGEILDRLRQGVPLRRMAALTFTRKAAEELRERARQAVAAWVETHPHDPKAQEAAREVYGAVFTTIHGFFAEALRHTAPLLSLDPDFALMDELLAEAFFLEEVRSLLYLEDQDPAWEELLRELYRKRPLAARFSPLPGAEEVVALYERALAAYRRRFAEALGPADLEALALRLVEHPGARKRLAERFSHLFLDEYQDLNPVQARFFQALEEVGVEVVAVGDPKQSIYLFRNARVEVFRQALARAERRVLDRTFRHAKTIARLLNRFVALFPEAERVPVVPERAEEGRVEVHWVVGEGELEAKRRQEARLLAGRLMALAQEGYAWREMAVLVRNRASLAPLERALREAGVPYALRRGRSFFTRPEVRDLYHALRLSLLEGPPSPEERLSLLAFLRGPFVGLDLGEVAEALRAEDPVPLLPPWVQERLQALKALSALSPLEALRRLARDEAFLRRLTPRARANLDTLLLLAASEGFSDLEALLDWLKVRTQDPEAAELPEGGEGVSLLTVHAAKGLEWRVVAVFDLARGDRPEAPPLLVGPEGEVALRGTPAYRDLKRAQEAADEEEALRLLYVALSRARDVLLLTGSETPRPGPWVKALARLGLGPKGQDPWVRRHPLAEGAADLPPPAPEPPPKPAPYAFWTPGPSPWPKVFSPSALKEAEAPLPLEEALEGVASAYARALGTLVHYALARHLDPEAPALEALLLQEVAFPFSPEEKRILLAEVRALLRNYRALLGSALPPLEARAEDHAELPLVLPWGGTVWYGVLDRLYRVGERWYLDDYKTDREVDPSRHRFQLALYREAVRQAWGVEAEARLVYLRQKEVHPFSPEALEAALKELPGLRPGREDQEV